MALGLYGGLFVHENGREVFFYDGCKWCIIVYTAALCCIVVRVIKYLIRYGIDYYFEKLAECQKHKED